MVKLNNRTVLAIAAIFIAAGVALLLKSRPAKQTPSTEAAAGESAQGEETNESAPLPVQASPETSAPPAAIIAPSRSLPVRNPLVANEDPNTPEGRIDQILLSEEMSDADKSTRLLEMLPKLPEPLQEEAAQHMCNLMPDEAYGQLGPLLTNGIAPEVILDVVMADLLSRPNSLKLPILLQMARNEQHPRREDCRSTLEVYLEHDFGSDWSAWEKSLQAYLKANPE
jgi:hypothetical protein